MRLPALSLPLPIRERLDEFVALPERARVKIAVWIAITLHLVIMLFSGIWISLFPAKPAPPPEDRSLTLTITPPESPVEMMAKKEETLTPEQELQLQVMFEQLPPEIQQMSVDVEGLARTKNMSKAALFYSWADSVEASEIEGEGDSPLPSQEGREDLPFTQFQNKDVTLGNAKVQEQKDVETKAIPPPKTLPPPPVVKPPEPKQTPPMQLAKADIPSNLKKVTTANDDEIALYLDRPSEPPVQPFVEPPPPPPESKPEPPIKLPQLLKTLPSPRPEPEPEKPKVEPPPPPPEPPKPEPPVETAPAKEEPFAMMSAKSQKLNSSGQSVEEVQTKIKGGKMKKGKKGVDAVATATGRYKKNVYMAVGSRWNYYIQQRGSLIHTGLVQIVVTLDAQGKIKSFRVEENSSNEAHAAMIEQCVREAEFDPPPPELLRNGVFEYPLSFHYY